MPNNEELEFSLSLDTEALKQGLSQAEALMAQGVERMNQMGMGQPTTVQPPIAPPPPGSTQPPIPPVPPASSAPPFPGTAPQHRFTR
ncbi:MAG: hypothetical protein KME18_16860 [Phormidium tanganyikae FI6-MK23]|jgi:hypothetical protein|nr:hypothetical protein [Phormidium tanganyikae FI6-MK23]